MLLKKRQFLTATLVVALAAAVFVNWYYSGTVSLADETTTSTQQVSGNLGDSLYVAGTTAAESSVNEDEYFAQAKIKRDKAHDEVMDSLEDMLEDDSLNSEISEQVKKTLDKFASDIKAESDSENLITAKTSCKCLVIINNDTCQVIMEKNSLNETIILQITEIISKNTNISAENLTIIEVK